MKIIFNPDIETLKCEDSRMSKIIDFYIDIPSALWIQLKSWDEEMKHDELFKLLKNKNKLKIILTDED